MVALERGVLLRWGGLTRFLLQLQCRRWFLRRHTRGLHANIMEELAKVYEPRSVERLAYELWQRAGSFHADAPADGPADHAYTIVIPPPNVTAALHLGHALNNTLQDILIRFHRMQGRTALWMPGTDHAGIATQTVVEKRILAEEGQRRTDFTREAFVARVQAWKDEYEARIIRQLQLMGCSCDWRRTRFTMDPVCARAVRAAFFKLFADGLIYRGKRLVNWDPATQTVLADDEVEHETVAGHFWYLRYPLVEPVAMGDNVLEHVTVATTRPETMLGDTAVAMNPADPRAKWLVGQKVRLPIVGRVIPVIADEHVVLPDAHSEDEKARFSTGFLKVTPAHDPADWEIGQRHHLPVINVMAPDGSISDRHGWEDATEPEARQLLGMDRFEAREAIVEWFRQEELLEEVREYRHDVGHSYRSHVPIEPYLSDQWYIAVKQPIEHLAGKVGSGLIEGTNVPVNSLAGLALKPLLDGRLRFIPERYAKTYQAWLENLRDWPISRQLWWGHRIPVWWCNDCGQTTSGIDDPVLCSGCGSRSLQQDEDVLDTWFSSALWPFSTLGWPVESKDLAAFYPGSVLCTAREIITLWVSRMVMMGQYCAGDIPFQDVFIHAMIQDGQGRKMSKSLGNGIDPLDVIDSHGADAMRFALAGMTTQTQDVRLPVEPMTLPDGRTVNSSPKFDLGRNFCNKLWNAARFALSNLDDFRPAAAPPAPNALPLEDRWILSRLQRTIAAVTEQLRGYAFSEPVAALYRFFWNELCDWYLEIIKARLREPARRAGAQQVLAHVLDATLRLLHPFLPFITEAIFQKLNEPCPHRGLPGVADLPEGRLLITASWPRAQAALIDEGVEQQMELLQTTIRLIREVRTRHQIPPRQALVASVKTHERNARLLQDGSMVRQLACLSDLQAGPHCVKGGDAAVAVAGELEIYVHGVINVEAEQARLRQQKETLLAQRARAEQKLGQEDFVQRAKPEVVQRERDRLVQLREQLATVEKNLADLG